MTVLICQSGDARLAYAGAEFSRLGYCVRYVGVSCGDTIDFPPADLLLLPVPATRDGVHLNCVNGTPPTLSEMARSAPARIFGGGFPAAFVSEERRLGREVTDLLTDRSFLEENAALTAEAAISVGMQARGESLRSLPVAVIGYGRIGSRLTRYLLSLGARVTVFARSEDAKREARLDGADAHGILCLPRRLAPARLVFNTVPAPLLTAAVTDTLGDAVIVELASGRGNVTLSEGNTGVTLYPAPSLPGRIFPRSAGAILARAVDQTLKNEGSPE